jgi:copper transport protein
MRLAVMLLLAALACPLAAAHAEPAHQDPAPGATLTAPPAIVQLDLTQPAEPAGYTFRLERIGTGIVPGHANRTANGLTLTLRPDAPLQNGTYVQHWAVVSAADGHPTSGAWSFVVGQPSGTAAASVTDQRILWGTALGQGALFTGLALVAGAVAWRWGMPDHILRARTAVAGGALLSVGGAGLLLGLAGDLGGLGPALASWHGRALAAYALLGTAAIAVHRRAWPLTAAAAGAILLAGSIGHGGGHAIPLGWWTMDEHATAGRVLAWLLADTHAAATATWAGGLAILAWGRVRGPAASLGDFSRLAVPAFAVTVLSGAVMATGLAGLNPLGWPATAYGQLLLAKLAIVAAMALLGAWHRTHHAKPATAARRSLATEAALGIVALLVTGFLAAASPEVVAAPKPAVVVHQPVDLNETVGPYTVRLQVAPGPAPGAASAWSLRIVDTQANQGVSDAIVSLQLHGSDPAAEPLPVPLAQHGFAWVAQGSFIPAPGHWTATIHFSTPRVADLEARFAVHVA